MLGIEPGVAGSGSKYANHFAMSHFGVSEESAHDPKNRLTVTFAALESRRLCGGGRWDRLDVDVRERRLEIEVVVLLNVGTDLLGLGHQDGGDAGELALVFPEVLLEVAGECARAENVPSWELVCILSSDNNSVTYRVQGLWPDFWRSTTYYKCELQFKDNCKKL